MGIIQIRKDLSRFKMFSLVKVSIDFGLQTRMLGSKISHWKRCYLIVDKAIFHFLPHFWQIVTLLTLKNCNESAHIQHWCTLIPTARRYVVQRIQTQIRPRIARSRYARHKIPHHDFHRNVPRSFGHRSSRRRWYGQRNGISGLSRNMRNLPQQRIYRENPETGLSWCRESDFWGTDAAMATEGIQCEDDEDRTDENWWYILSGRGIETGFDQVYWMDQKSSDSGATRYWDFEGLRYWQVLGDSWRVVARELTSSWRAKASEYTCFFSSEKFRVVRKLFFSLRTSLHKIATWVSVIAFFILLHTWPWNIELTSCSVALQYDTTSEVPVFQGHHFSTPQHLHVHKHFPSQETKRMFHSLAKWINRK